jgi:hypothetical protein
MAASAGQAILAALSPPRFHFLNFWALSLEPWERWTDDVSLGTRSMKFLKKEERDPFAEEAFAQRLAAIAGRTKDATDPYGTRQDQSPVAA